MAETKITTHLKEFSEYEKEKGRKSFFPSLFIIYKIYYIILLAINWHLNAFAYIRKEKNNMNISSKE